MTVRQRRAATDWQTIDWYRVQRSVRRLQARIVQAQQAGRRGKVKALQRLLTHSRSAKLLAVKRVTQNHGNRTPGVDGEVWDTPDKKMAAVRALRRRGYRPRPLRRVHIPKRDGRRRPLGIPAMLDRAMQTLALLALDPLAETTADPNSYGFRPERSAADAVAQCFNVLGKRHSASWILEGDIQACFDRLGHDWLEAHVPTDTALLRTWLKAGFLEHQRLHPTAEGTPQGGPLSPVLANCALDGLERLLRERFPKPKHGYNPKVNLIRYADDFVVTGDSRELLEREARPLIEAFLGERGLVLSPEKTVITHIADGFDFLGQHIRKYRGKLLITPARKNVQAFMAKVRGIVKGNKQATAGHLIAQLDPVIRGWARYHRHVVSKAAFNRVDRAIFLTLWQWARRRHPRKGARWVREKYFRSAGNRNWVFTGEVQTASGPARVDLFAATSVPIERHVKVKEGANPYDPQWEPYFEQRLAVAMERHLHGRRRLLYLWKEQQGRCPHCTLPITTLTGWHRHHLVWRSKGGSDRVENLVLLHPDCHRAVHNRGLTVVKPRPIAGTFGKA